ncbi:hypothetical protein IAT40_001342 [Kwoniella sp. CBS 6097]
MLLANYASDSDDGSDVESSAPAQAPAPASVRAAASASAAKPASTAKPVVKAKKPIKITLDLPKSGAQGDEVKDDVGEGDQEVDRGLKSKIAGGKGGSSLLGMLPPPKRKLPQPKASSSTLGSSSGSGSRIQISKPSSSSGNPKPASFKPLLASTKAQVAAGAATQDDEDEDEDRDDGEKLLPPSLARKRKEKESEENLDLFGLASASSTPAPSIPSSTNIKPPSISSAPLAPDYVPPTPTSADPYPGYYQLPSGEWRAYDPAYYASFFSSANAEGEEDQEQDDGRVGKHWKDFDSGRYGGVVEVDAFKGVEDARREEERRQMAKRPRVSEDSFEYKPTGQVKGLASQRHQLTSLLNTAYTQREELEDRIAANKKSMRMAGTKYADHFPPPSLLLPTGF